jgi:hypothetical protein
MQGRTPDEVFDELLPPGQRRLIESPEVLYALFWDRQRRSAGPFDKAKLSAFLESTLRLNERSIPPRDAGRSIASAVLLTSYIVQNCERVGNHWALFEAWVVTSSYILCVASRYRMAAKWWNNSFELCSVAAVRALDALCQECADNQTAFVQSDPVTDGDFYPMRMTILAGALTWTVNRRKSTRLSRCVRIVIAKYSPEPVLETALPM